MSRLFNEEGASIPCTIVRVATNYVSQVKTVERDGYLALQVSNGERRASRVTRAVQGHYKKTSTPTGNNIREFCIGEGELKKAGETIGVEIFSEGQKVKVTGTSKGKGFAGTIKRHNFHGQDNSHGNSLAHRVMGSVGQCQTPGRVFKGKKMPGQMGNARVTVRNLEIIKVDKDRQLIWIKGAVPGSRNSTVVIEHLASIDIQAISEADDDTNNQTAQTTESQTEKPQPIEKERPTQATAQTKTTEEQPTESKETKKDQATAEVTAEAKTSENSDGD